MSGRLRLGVLLCLVMLQLSPAKASAGPALGSRASLSKHSRIVVFPGGARSVGDGSNIVIEGDPSNPSGGTPPVYTFGDLTLRPAQVFLSNPFTPLASRLLPLRSPGQQLAGDFITDVQLEGTANHLPPLPDGTYDYAPFGADDMAFNQVNAYNIGYSLIQSWFTAYGWDYGIAPIGIRIHTTPSQTIIGQYEGGYAGLYPALIGGVVKHTAKDADLVRHEITHCVLIPSCPPLTGDPDDYFAFHEGMADFVAGITGPDLVIGEWIVPNGLRDLTNNDPTLYNMSNFNLLKANPYEAGRILTGALLTIRQSLHGTLDALVVAATSYPGPASLRGFADAVRSADIDLNGGANLSVINAAFAAHGLTPGSVPRLTPNGPFQVSAGQSYTYYLDVFGGYGPFGFNWSESTDGGASWSSVGSTVIVNLAFSASCLLRCQVTDQLGGVFTSEAVPITVFQGPVPPPLTAVQIVGPTAVAFGDMAHYSISANAPFVSPASWDIFPDGGGGIHQVGDALDITVMSGFTLRVTANGVTGGQATAQIHVDVTTGNAFVDRLNGGGSKVIPDGAPGASVPRITMRALYSRSGGEMSVDFGALVDAGPWRARMFDIRGGAVASKEGTNGAGVQRLWSPAEMAPGVYFVQVAAGARRETFRTVIVP